MLRSPCDSVPKAIDSFGRPAWQFSSGTVSGSSIRAQVRRQVGRLPTIKPKRVHHGEREQLFPSTYYKAADVRDGPIALTISHVPMEPVGEGANKADKAVAYFCEENSKRLVLSPTKFDAIALIAKSDETDDWSGTKIVLEAGKAMFQGKLVDCVNVRAPRKPIPPKSAKTPVAPQANVAEVEFDDEVPF